MMGAQPGRETDREKLLELYKKKYCVVDTNRFAWVLLNAPKGKKIIDIGCCFGAMFRPYNWENVTNVDLNDYSHMVPNFVKANAINLPFENNSFDIAVITEILEHQNTWEDSVAVVKEACRVAKKVILSVPNEYIWMNDAEHRFKTWEECLKEEGYDMSRKAVQEAPLAKEYDKGHGHFDHIFHHHQFGAEDIEELIKCATDRDYYIYIFPNDGATEKAIGTTAAIIS